MIVRLVEVFENKKFTQESKKYAMREVFVNPDHVVCLRSEPNYGKLLARGFTARGTWTLDRSLPECTWVEDSLAWISLLLAHPQPLKASWVEQKNKF